MGVSTSRILIAADRSSAGKTTITMGLGSLLSKRGVRVQPFKVALDYIDSSYHTELTGRACRNLDGFLMSDDTILESFSKGVDGADLALIEGVRGLYEGLEARSDVGSTAQIAKLLSCPVVLVVNARSITRSAAALVEGYRQFDREVDIRGVILNQIGSSAHAEKAVEAIESYTDVRVLGVIPRTDEMTLTMRHLGLVPALEGKLVDRDRFEQRVRTIEHILSEHVDIDALLRIAREAAPLPLPRPAERHEPSAEVRVGVAMDEAFNFYYPENLEALEGAGAVVVPFSPVRDAHMPDVDGLYLGGGYPELFAESLEHNEDMRAEILGASSSGMPVFAECGGLLYLARSISIDVEGFLASLEGRTAEQHKSTYEMVGALPADAVMGKRRVVRYTVGTFTEDTPIGGAGTHIKGHEFHHSSLEGLKSDATFALSLSRGVGIDGKKDGFLCERTLAQYSHIHALSYRGFAPCFVAACKTFKRE